MHHLVSVSLHETHAPAVLFIFSLPSCKAALPLARPLASLSLSYSFTMADHCEVIEIIALGTAPTDPEVDVHVTTSVAPPLQDASRMSSSHASTQLSFLSSGFSSGFFSLPLLLFSLAHAQLLF